MERRQSNYHYSRLGTEAVRLIVFALAPIVIVLTLPPIVVAADLRIDYLRYCSGCHLSNGEGSPPNVPTLHDELGGMMRVPEMRGYLARVPGSNHAPISDARLTAVINWILQEFNANTLPEGFQQLTLEEVSAARANLLADPNKYRETYWKAYDFLENNRVSKRE